MKDLSARTKKERSLEKALENILTESKGQSMTVQQICSLLEDKGFAVLFIVLSFPVCFPITMPGICAPIGILMAFLGMRLVFKKHMWWPKWILAKEVPYYWLKTVIEKIIIVSRNCRKIVRTRLTFLVLSPTLLRVHGLLICVLSLLLALPLPIPFTNTFAAVPIFILGIALLEDDGVAVIIAYTLALICFFAFGTLFWLGETGVQWLWNTMYP